MPKSKENHGIYIANGATCGVASHPIPFPVTGTQDWSNQRNDQFSYGIQFMMPPLFE